MQISSRFTVALHIFACVEYFRDKCKVTSDFLASQILSSSAEYWDSSQKQGLSES